MVKNGDKVRHRVTGLEGVVMGITDWLFGCHRIHIQPMDLNDGRPQELVALDDGEVEVVTAGFLLPKELLPEVKVKKPRGGPRDYNIQKGGEV